MADIEKKDLAEETATADAPKKKDAGKAKKDKSEKAKSDKPSIPSRIIGWFRSCKSEMKKIVWASPKTVFSNSLMVIVAIVAVAVALGALDYVFNTAIGSGLPKLISLFK